MNLCKKCKKNKRVSLYFCSKCLDKHNYRTRELKRKYRKEGKCVMCSKPSNGKRKCKDCEEKNKEYVKNSKYLQSKKSKQGCYGMKQIIEVL